MQTTVGYQVGCPIRKSPDQSLFAAPRSLSQRTTSFIASYRQGIHQTPFMRLIRSRRQTAVQPFRPRDPQRRPRTREGIAPPATRTARSVSCHRISVAQGRSPCAARSASLSSRCQKPSGSLEETQKVQTNNGRDACACPAGPLPGGSPCPCALPSRWRAREAPRTGPRGSDPSRAPPGPATPLRGTGTLGGG